MHPPADLTAFAEPFGAWHAIGWKDVNVSAAMSGSGLCRREEQEPGTVRCSRYRERRAVFNNEACPLTQGDIACASLTRPKVAQEIAAAWTDRKRFTRLEIESMEMQRMAGAVDAGPGASATSQAFG